MFYYGLMDLFEGKLLVIYLIKVYGECQQKIIMHHMQINEEERKGWVRIIDNISRL